MIELDQLKKLVLSDGYDEESKESVRVLEKQLSETAVLENIKNVRPVKDYYDWLKSELARCETLLRIDRKLTDRERDALFNRIDLCKKFLDIFGAEKESVEKEIKELLNVVLDQNRI